MQYFIVIAVINRIVFSCETCNLYQSFAVHRYITILIGFGSEDTDAVRAVPRIFMGGGGSFCKNMDSYE